MSVDVDQAGRHNGAAYILDMPVPLRECFADGGDLAGLDGDVEHVVYAITLVEDAAAFQDEVVALRGWRFHSWDPPIASAGVVRTGWSAPHLGGEAM